MTTTTTLRGSRGQAMVLAVLCSLLLALLVLVTLSLGTRIKERMEAQVAADAAAYSEAVITARTYNELALLNRIQIGAMVALFGQLALTDWASHHVGNLDALVEGLAKINGEYASECDPVFNPCPCTQIGPTAASLTAATRELNQVRRQWDGLETAAAEQSRQTFAAAEAAYELQFDAYMRLERGMKDQSYAAMVVASTSDELSAPPKADSRNYDELERAAWNPADDPKAQQSLQALMGSRGFDFVTNRTGGQEPIRQKLESLARVGNGAASVDPAADKGGTGAGNSPEDQTVKRVDHKYAAIAEDHGGSLQLNWPAACSKSASPSVKDSRLFAGGANGINRHTYGGRDSQAAQQRHRLGGTRGRFWPNQFQWYPQAMKEPDDDYRQPHLAAVIERDLRKVPTKPWDMHFSFKFGSGPGSKFDDLSPTGALKSPAGADLSKQTAFSSSIVYYHRPDAWAEPPNFMNPFWRATLAADDGTAAKLLRKAGDAEHAKTLELLKSTAGYGVDR
jgi:hypothetical protein